MFVFLFNPIDYAFLSRTTYDAYFVSYYDRFITNTRLFVQKGHGNQEVFKPEHSVGQVETLDSFETNYETGF